MKLLHSINDLAQLGKPIWATVGFFDGLHLGHQELLSSLNEQARAANAYSLVITFSNLPRAYHQPGIEPRYLTLPEEKILLLQAQGVGAVLMLEYGEDIASQSSSQFINNLAASCDLRGLCIGYDTTLGNDMLSGRPAFRELAESAGIEMVFAKELRLDGVAVKSSQVRKLVEAGDVRGATQLLKRPYFILGEVVHGKGKGGKLLDTPTANLILPPDKLCPPVGVYACTCQVGSESYPAATVVMNHVIANTTPLEDSETTAQQDMLSDGTVIVETNLDGFSGNLYGKKIRLYFHARLRDWIHFDTAEELQAQIKTDIKQTRMVCSWHS